MRKTRTIVGKTSNERFLKRKSRRKFRQNAKEKKMLGKNANGAKGRRLSRKVKFS